MKQVDRDHYRFEAYESPERFTSYYYQVRSVLQLAPKSILEVGVGSRVFAMLMKQQNVATVTLDIDPNLRPSVSGNILQLPFQDCAVDVCVAFQTLEHLPFEQFGSAVAELARVARKGIVLSLPEFGNAAVATSIPFVRKLRFTGRALAWWYPQHSFDGEHYWEINKRGYRLRDVKLTMTSKGLTLVDSSLNPYNPYHRFFVLLKDA
jgi:ubiquinone/menaquinone biosynthesis C-methylase UbiE